MVIYRTVEWVGECGLLGSLRKLRKSMTAPFPSPTKPQEPCALLIVHKEIKRIFETFDWSKNSGRVFIFEERVRGRLLEFLR